MVIVYYYYFLLGQIDPLFFMTMGFFLPSSKGATTSFKPIYNCCWQQWGVFFSFFVKNAMIFFQI
jgi:hypothetical protein